MSKHAVHTPSRVLSDIRHMSIEQLCDAYGIEVDEDGVVWDPTENREFKTLEAWAQYIDQLENEDNFGSFTKIGGKHGYDDDGY